MPIRADEKCRDDRKKWRSEFLAYDWGRKHYKLIEKCRQRWVPRARLPGWMIVTARKKGEEHHAGSGTKLVGERSSVGLRRHGFDRDRGGLRGGAPRAATIRPWPILENEDGGAAIEAMLADGKTPLVQLPAGSKVITPKRSPGRPRKYPLGARHPKAGGHRMRTPSGHALRCRWRGCSNYISKDAEAITCSERCTNMLREFIRATLDVLDGRMPAVDYPSEYRARRLA